MYDKRRECRHIPIGSSIEREIRAIKETQKLNNLEIKDSVIPNFKVKLFKSLYRILIKISKAL